MAHACPGSGLVAVSGPGEVGLVNLGASCYLASIMQAVSEVQPFAERMIAYHRSVAANVAEDPSDNALAQTAKLVWALLSDRYAGSPEDPHHVGIAPRSFKRVVGKGHPEFSTPGQQDAAEFLGHLFTVGPWGAPAAC